MTNEDRLLNEIAHWKMYTGFSTAEELCKALFSHFPTPVLPEEAKSLWLLWRRDFWSAQARIQQAWTDIHNLLANIDAVMEMDDFAPLDQEDIAVVEEIRKRWA